MTDVQGDAVQRAEAYYDSVDADAFYRRIWGGEDIHIGIYQTPGEDIATASRRTVETMAGMIQGLGAATEILDIGAGYGGSARLIAERYSAIVRCLNISEIQNAYNRERTAAEGLDDRLEVVHGSFEEIPQDDRSCDVVWSQDAILHSADRTKVLAEVARVLRPGGQFIFTDPMQAEDCPDGVLDPILARIHLDSLGSFGFYDRELTRLGFEKIAVTDLTGDLGRHYARVREELRSRYDEMAAHASHDYMDTMIAGLGRWVDGQAAGHLAWGIMHYRLRG